MYPKFGKAYCLELQSSKARTSVTHGWRDRPVCVGDGVLSRSAHTINQRSDMTRTEYSWMETEELLLFALNRKQATSLEVELAQRLTVAQDVIIELESLQHGDNSRRPCQSGGS